MTDITAGQRAALAVEDGGTRADAELHGVPYPSVKLARVVLARSPEAFAELRAGKIGVTKAHKLTQGKPKLTTDLVPILAKRSVAELVEWGKEALDRAGTSLEVRKVKATAAALEAYQRSVKAGEEAIQAAREIKLRADRKLSLAYEALEEKNKGGRPKKTGSSSDPVSRPTTLAEMGFDKHEADTARLYARATAEQFEAGLEALREAGELTEDGMKKLMREAVRGGMGEDEIKASVAAVKAKREAKRTPEDKERAKASDAATSVYGLDGLELFKLDPILCAQSTEWFLRPRRLVVARSCLEWLQRFTGELERLGGEDTREDAA